MVKKIQKEPGIPVEKPSKTAPNQQKTAMSWKNQQKNWQTTRKNNTKLAKKQPYNKKIGKQIVNSKRINNKKV